MLKIAANIISVSFAQLSFHLEMGGVAKRTTLWDSVLFACMLHILAYAVGL